MWIARPRNATSRKIVFENVTPRRDRPFHNRCSKTEIGAVSSGPMGMNMKLLN
jgi:hypothetical protein